MDIFDKIGCWFQVVASVYFVLFSLFQIIRAMLMRSEAFYIVCFAALLLLSCGLLRLSVVELKDLKGGKK